MRAEPRVLGRRIRRAEAGEVHADEALHPLAHALGMRRIGIVGASSSR